MIDGDCEFPAIPKKFDDFQIVPIAIETSSEFWKSELILRNHSDTGILYKVKCTSNKRLQVFDCADILLPGNEIVVQLKKIKKSDEVDQLLVLYCLVGKQWSNEGANALSAWKRVKSREVVTKSVIVPIVQRK